MTLFLNSKGIAYTPELLDEFSLAIADSAVESAVDLLVSQNEDTQIGTRMLAATLDYVAGQLGSHGIESQRPGD
jgi:hypothetical protein